MNLSLKKTVYFAVPALVVLFFATQSAIAINNTEDSLDALFQSLTSSPLENNEANYFNIIKAIRAFNEALRGEGKNAEDLLTHWDEYLRDVTHFSNDDFSNAIEIQVRDYQRAVTNFSDIIKHNDENNKEAYSSSWVNDLLCHFGKTYIVNNKESVLSSLLAISNSNKAYDEGLKELIFVETMLYGSYQRYFSLFINFYNDKLDKDARKEIESQQKFAHTFIEMIKQPPIKTMHDNTLLLKIMSEHKARKLNNDIFDFLTNHPLSNSLELMRALDDLMQALD